MKIKRVSMLTGILREQEIDVTQEQIDRWESGELIQKVMPHLSTDEREFIISGVTADEWDEEFKEND